MRWDKTDLIEELRQRRGVTAEATVISIKEHQYASGWLPANNGSRQAPQQAVLQMTLRVTPDDAPEFEANLTQRFTTRFPSRNELVEVIYDSNDHSKVAVTRIRGWGLSRTDQRAYNNKVVEQILRGELRSDGTPYVSQDVADELRGLVVQRQQGALSEDDYQAHVAAIFKRVPDDRFGPVQSSAPPVQVGSAPAASERADTVDELGKLAALKQQGLLSEAEFAAAKAKVLGT